MASCSKRPRLSSMNDSLVSEKLLNMIGRGTTHISQAVELARVCQADGLQAESLRVLAGLGAGGQHDQNIERDLHRQVCGLWGFQLEPYEIKLRLNAALMYTSSGYAAVCLRYNKPKLSASLR